MLIAYHLQKMPYVIPLVGGNKVEQLRANIEALKVVLSEAQVKEIEAATPFDAGFPHNYIVRAPASSLSSISGLMPPTVRETGALQTPTTAASSGSMSSPSPKPSAQPGRRPKVSMWALKTKTCDCSIL